jgi:Fe-Mn family superoxide dismutase
MSTTCATKPFEAKTYPKLANGLTGISKELLEEHVKLYQGYCTNTEKVVTELKAMVQAGTLGTPTYNELKRRLGFEANGVLMHELYFDNMKPDGGPIPQGGKLYNALVECYGSYANWEADFKATGLIRGIGWAALYQCACTGMFINMWIGEHEIGHPTGAKPILIMDVWEHAYANDYKPTGRKAYIDAFFNNIDWAVVESRLN